MPKSKHELSPLLHRALISCLVFVLAFVSVSLQAQSFNFRNYSTDQGLAQSQVLSIYQDRLGYIWFGTNSGGISRFDGIKFRNFTKQQGLSDDVIFSITEDYTGKLLFATINGLTVHDHNRFKTYGAKEGLPSATIYRLLTDENKVWLCTEKGIFVYQDGKIKPFELGDSTFRNSSFYCIYKDSDKNVWFGTLQNGLYKYDPVGKTLNKFDITKGLSSNMIFCISQTQNGVILVGTQQGLCKITRSLKIQVDSTIKNSNNISFSTVQKKSNDEFLFGTFNEGLIKYNFTTGKTEVFDSKNGLTNNSIYAVFTDREGIDWIGTSGKGFYKFQGKKFTYYTKQNGLPDDYINAINTDTSGTIWASIYGHGLVRIDARGLKLYKAEYNNKQALPDNNINAIQNGANGSIYFGTETGLAVFKNDQFKIIDNSNFNSKYIQSLFEDHHHQLWIGTNEGVWLYSGDSLHYVSELDKYKKDSQFLILFIHETQDGELLFGTEYGMIGLKEHKTTNYQASAGFVTTRACNATRDARGNMWLGTSEGLFQFDGKHFQKILNATNTPFGFITFLVASNDNNLYIGTNQEITILNLTDFYAGKRNFKILTREEGLLSRESNFNVAALTPANFLMVGTASGIEIYDPKIDVHNTLPAQISLRGIKLFFGLEDVTAFGEGVDSLTGLPINLRLPNDKDNLTFEFTGICMMSPEKVNYSWKLEGLDQEWTPPVTINEAVYPSIPPGTYTFYVKAMNNDGLWSEPIQYTFTIIPPWYKTWLFRILLILALIAGTYFFIVFRERKLVKEKAILETIVKERTNEIVEQKQLLEHKHKEITDSIVYAERIQRSFLATKHLLDSELKDYFILFQPKEAVSGDFYWGTAINGAFLLATADSTGHGVPGAIMSILNISSLENAVKSGLTEPGSILDYTRKGIIERLKNDGSEAGGKDGMDVTLIKLQPTQRKLTFAGANNSIWIVRNNELIELHPDKMPVGKHDKDHLPFSQQEFDLLSNDMIYTFTDGLPDQFGGPRGKKFMYSQFKKLLLANAALSTDDQLKVLKSQLVEWMGDLEQVDDITVIGIRIA